MITFSYGVRLISPEGHELISATIGSPFVPSKRMAEATKKHLESLCSKIPEGLVWEYYDSTLGDGSNNPKWERF